MILCGFFEQQKINCHMKYPSFLQVILRLTIQPGSLREEVKGTIL
jgi:hypothetical protein